MMITWGRENSKGCQGYAFERLDRRYWIAGWSELWDTIERDGYMKYGSNHWFSLGGKTVSYPYAVIDDYGALVPVDPTRSL